VIPVRLLQMKPYMLRDKEGPLLPSLGALVSVKATSEQTGGVFNLFDVVCPPGYATPLHIHYAEDVVIYVLAGTLTLFWGGEKKVADAGSYFYQPRGTPHGFRVANEAPARLLHITFPAGLDHLVDHLVIEQGSSLPNAECVTAAARHKIETLGPLPE
jgi:quercetin dioxygenase-like cupin family protein